MQSDGSRIRATPSFEERNQEGKVSISFKARSVDEAKQMVAGIKRKYPTVDADSILRGLQEQYSYTDEPLQINISVGGHLAGRSFVKSCLALASYYGATPEHFDEAISYIRNESNQPCFGYFYIRDLVCSRPQKPFHCVAVHADPKTQLATGYLELYGVFRIVCSLSRSYNGPILSAAYAVDPMNGETLSTKVDLTITEDELATSLSGEISPADALQKAFEPILAAGIKRDFELERDRAISKAVDYAFANCGAKEGDILSQQQITLLGRLSAEQLMPFFQRHMVRPVALKEFSKFRP